MKLVLLCVLVFAAVARAQQSGESVVLSSSEAVSDVSSGSAVECRDNYTCVGDGDECTYDSFVETCAPWSEKCCAKGYYCVNEKCKKSTENDVCDAAHPCLAEAMGTQMITCLSGKCAAVVNAGDSCNSANVCYGSMLCGSNGKCTGSAAGANCTRPLKQDPLGLAWRSIGMSCAQGLFCNDESVCELYRAKSEACGVGLPPCGPNLVCDSSAGGCIELYSKVENSPCEGTFMCKSGLECVTNVCLKRTEPALTKCTDDDNCKNGAVCVCDFYSGKKYCTYEPAYTCMDEQEAMYSCFADQKCTAGYFSVASESCQQSKCGNEQEQYHICALCDYDSIWYYDCIAREEMDKYCPALETWEKLVILAVIVVVVIVIIIIITACCCCSKRNQAGYNEVTS